MSRLNKANNDGSVSVIIPKRLLNILKWTTQDEVVISLNKTQDKIIIQKIEQTDI